MASAIPNMPTAIPMPEARSKVHPAFVMFTAMHIPLTLLMNNHEQVATVHAMSVFVLGLWWAVSAPLERVAYIAAYITGAEVLWRMTDAGVFWEFGKYSVSAILVAALVVRRLGLPRLPVLYFAMLLPSIAATVAASSPDSLRMTLSFHLSGPFALAVAVAFFWHVRLSAAQFRRLLLVAIGPIIGIVSVAVFSTVTAPRIEFTTESNSLTSGGFGPNQVSSVLGLGSLFAVLAIYSNPSRLVRWALAIVTLVFIGQAMLTFSRSGVYLAAIGTLVGSCYMIKGSRDKLKILIPVMVGVLTLVVYVFPQLDDVTGGNLATRFRQTHATSRTAILASDLDIWMDNPVLGVGPGISDDVRLKRTRNRVTAHTEFSRLVAEHGVFGFMALLLLVFMAVRAFRKARHPWHRAAVAALLVYSFCFMLVNGMRIVAPPFMFGLAFAGFTESIWSSRTRHAE